MPKFLVTVEFRRVAIIEIEAEDGLDARSKVGNYEFDEDIIGDLCGWRVLSTEKYVESTEIDLGSHSVLSMEIDNQMKSPFKE
jgi:hypothetical protein